MSVLNAKEDSDQAAEMCMQPDQDLHCLSWSLRHFYQNILNMGINIGASKPDFAACEQQRHRPACASAQSDQHLCYSLSGKHNS